MSDAEVKYYRLASLLFDSNGSVLQDYLKHQLSTGPYQTLQNMLSTEKHNLFHTYWKPQLDCRSCTNCNYTGNRSRKPLLTSAQWDKLFIPNPIDPCHSSANLGSRSCQYDPNAGVREEDLDVTLITFLLLNFFSGINANVKQTLQDLRSARNELCHSSRASLDDSHFSSIWSKGETAILIICSEISQAKYNDVKTEIVNLKSRDMDAQSSTRLLRILKDSVTEVSFRYNVHFLLIP